MFVAGRSVAAWWRQRPAAGQTKKSGCSSAVGAVQSRNLPPGRPPPADPPRSRQSTLQCRSTDSTAHLPSQHMLGW